MKFLILASVSIALVAAASEPSIEELDIKSLLKDEAKAQEAFNCLMDRGPCGDMQSLRDSLPQLIETRCSQCTPKQKEKYDEVTKVLAEKKPKEFQALAAKYSPKSE